MIFMSVRSKIKTNARKAVSQSFIKALSVTLILICIVFLYSIFVLAANAIHDLFGMPLSMIFESTLPILSNWNYIFSPIILGGTIILQLILFSPLLLGVAGWFYALVGGEEPQVVDLFDFFAKGKRYFGSIWLQINLLFRGAVYGFLFLIAPFCLTSIGLFLVQGAILPPGLSEPAASLIGSMLTITGVVLTLVAILFLWIFLKRYFLVPYLFAQGGCSVRQAIRQSIFGMKGRKSELFLFDLSFLGWFLLCLFLLPIAFVFPYYQGASALYARVIIEQMRRQDSVPKQSALSCATQEFDTPDEEAAKTSQPVGESEPLPAAPQESGEAPPEPEQDK